MRRYECVVILDPEMADDDILIFNEKYSQLIKANTGEVIKIEDWGSKKLAYLVKKKDRGRYILFDFVGTPTLIAEMERRLKITEEVMKYLTVKLEDQVDLEAFKASREAAEPAPVEPSEDLPEAAEAETAPEAPVETAPEVEPQPQAATEPAEAPVEKEGE